MILRKFAKPDVPPTSSGGRARAPAMQEAVSGPGSMATRHRSPALIARYADNYDVGLPGHTASAGAIMHSLRNVGAVTLLRPAIPANSSICLLTLAIYPPTAPLAERLFRWTIPAWPSPPSLPKSAVSRT